MTSDAGEGLQGLMSAVASLPLRTSAGPAGQVVADVYGEALAEIT